MQIARGMSDGRAELEHDRRHKNDTPPAPSGTDYWMVDCGTETQPATASSQHHTKAGQQPSHTAHNLACPLLRLCLRSPFNSLRW
jgi:hypothetical protein